MRADLLALTPEALVSLANRGLFKRATKEMESSPPMIVETDGTVVATAADGTITSIAPGVAIDASQCSCSATAMCRHRLALVLAYQAWAMAADGDEPPAPFRSTPTIWDPGSFTDDQLENLLGRRTMAAARRLHKAGYSARVIPATVADPPAVELAACTVRFLVPHELTYATPDADANPECIALAVWAARQAQGIGSEVSLDIGGQRDGSVVSAIDVLDVVASTGIAESTTMLDVTVQRLRRSLDTAGQQWSVDAVDDLLSLLAAYRDRGASYDTRAIADIVVEVLARERCAVNGGASLRSRVLGLEERAESQLRRIRLDSLGVRIDERGGQVQGRVFVAEPGTGHVLTITKTWPIETDLPTGADLAGRRVLPRTSLGALAGGTLLSESVIRSASRKIVVRSNRVAKTTVAPTAADWSTYPTSLRCSDISSLITELRALPPKMLRPRIDAELVRVVEIGEVVSLGYEPGDQRLDVLITDPSGTTAMLRSTYRPTAPAALETIADALGGAHGTPRFVSGVVGLSGGTLVLDVIAISADQLVLPDLAPGTGQRSLDLVDDGAPHPIVRSIDAAWTLLADLLHRGLDNTTPGSTARLRVAAGEVRALGLHEAARRIEVLAEAATQRRGIFDAWFEAALFLAVCRERHHLA